MQANSTPTIEGVSMMQGSMSMSMIDVVMGLGGVNDGVGVDDAMHETKDTIQPNPNPESRIQCSRQNNWLPAIVKNGAPRSWIFFSRSFQNWREKQRFIFNIANQRSRIARIQKSRRRDDAAGLSRRVRYLAR